MRRTFRTRLLVYFSVIFILFSVLVTILQYSREKNYRVEKLESTLDQYNTLINNYIQQHKLSNPNDFTQLDTIGRLIANNNVRFTVIAENGEVLYDTWVEDPFMMENHIDRPEIQKAIRKGTGYKIRHSATLQRDFFYFARSFDHYFIRSALPYTQSTIDLLKIDYFFLYVMALIFMITIFGVGYFSNRFGNNIAKLYEFAIRAGNKQPIPKDMPFPENELGDISRQIVNIYRDLKETRDELTFEKEKLITHLNYSESGLGIFDSNKRVILSNSHFIQNISHISDITISSAEKVFQIEELQPVVHFIDSSLNLKEKRIEDTRDFSQYTQTIDKNGHFFNVQCLVFKDQTIDILIRDITQMERQRKLKKELTNNIAHELKTPVASIQGYLDTIINHKEMETDKKEFFLERAYQQILRLGNLVNDISTLNKMEEATKLFINANIDLKEVISSVIQDVYLKMDELGVSVELNLPAKMYIEGERSLLYSIFRNLADNALKYAGEDFNIYINCYLENEEFYYISFSDNGNGVPEKHLVRLFERFYRIDKGRSRKMGGTGLGLAIVKNAVLFHGGDISAKNKVGGGLEFLFSLRKKKEQ